VLQYGLIGEVSVAARDRLRSTLQANLARLSQDFTSEIFAACRGLLPASGGANAADIEAGVLGRFEAWKKSPHSQLVRRFAIAIPHDGATSLQLLDLDRGRFEPAEWPAEWEPVRRRIEARLSPAPGGMPPSGRGDMEPPGHRDSELTLEYPFVNSPEGRMAQPFGRREVAWAVFDLDLPYIRNVILPDVLQRHLESGGTLEYEVEVVARGSDTVIYASDPDATHLSANADASIGLFDVGFGQFAGGGRGGRGGRGNGRGPGFGPDSGRWQMFVRHRAGSLEAVVAKARWRNLAITASVLLLLVVTLGALVRFTRNAQRLAQLQMDFVAGVSHELRTPLTALYTAGHNLRGKVAQQPSQVERYGEMIQHEAGRLKDLVEQVLRFASAGAGHVIQQTAPISVASVIDDTVSSSRPVLQAAQCTVETHIAPELPLVMGDPMALKHALQNLLTNAVKYGATDSHWIGITAAETNGSHRPEIEIRVADRGPGIPAEEQQHIFDAFYRGRRAIQDQVHGAGLGLNMVKKIVEAHGGSIRVHSAPSEGAEFILRLPAMPAGAAS
jgi:signal transduction histidine kinase